MVTNVADVGGFLRLEAEGVSDLITMPWALYGHGGGGGPLDKELDDMKCVADEAIRASFLGPEHGARRRGSDEVGQVREEAGKTG